MKRDMELVRKILLAVEADQPTASFDGFSEDEVKYHKALLIDFGLAEGRSLPNSSGQGSSQVPANVILRKLTWEGHDFIDAISDDSKWGKVKDFLAESGKQVTIETVKVAVTRLFGFE